MLTIPQRLPIKRMAMYGSTAMLVGFTGTLALLREFAPKDSPTGVSIVKTINKKPTKTTANGVETKQADEKSTGPALPDQRGLVVRSSDLSTQQAPRTSTANPTPVASGMSAPVSAFTPTQSSTMVAPSVTGGSSADTPSTTATQPSTPLPSTSILQRTVNDLNTPTYLLP